MKTQSPKSGRSASGVPSSGTRMVEKYRPRTSRLTDEERQKLMERGMQIVCGNSTETSSANRR